MGDIRLSWVLIALAAAAITALVSISDKTVMYRYARSPLTLPLLIGFAQSIVGIVSLGLSGIPPEATVALTLSATLSGILFGLSGILHQRVLFTQEVSRTIPVIQSSPIFAALLSMAVLGEAVSSLQWAGIIGTVAGSVLISLQIQNGAGRVFLHSSFYVLMLSAFLFGAAMVVGKIAVDELPILYTHGLRMLALGCIFLAFTLRKAPWEDVKGFFRARSPALLFASTNEFITANVGLLLLLWALSVGPAALVTALLGTRALFVVLYTTILASVWKGALGEQISHRIVATKVISLALIVTGVVAIVL